MTDQIGFAGPDGTNTVAASPTNPLPAGASTVASAGFTRPADTTAYASGDLVANSTTAASVAPMQFTVARANDAAVSIRRARLKTSSPSVTNASFRLHLYRNDPSASSGIANGDNGAWSTKEAQYIGSLDITVDKAFSDAAKGVGVPTAGGELTCRPAAGTTVIYGLLEARAAYTPTSGETFTAELEVLQN